MGPSHDIPPPPPSRRSFLKWVTNGLGAVVGLVIGIPAVAYLIDARHRKASESDFRTVAKLSELQVNEPKQVTISDTRSDAWTLHPNELIGRVWLIRREGDKVKAFTSTCPHLGCSINFEEKKKHFLCPCHGASFNLEGQKLERGAKKNPSPRNMDGLSVEVVPDPANEGDAFVQVKYEKFAPG